MNFNIKTDSRKVKKGDIFVALKGIESDGHDYIDKAIENGAVKVIAQYGQYDVETVIVDDTRKYLNNYLEENYNKYLEKINIIALTGTNGKTTTAKLLHDALNRLGSKTAYIGTIGFYIEEKVMDLPNTTVDICETYELLLEAYFNGCKNVVMEVSSQAISMGRVETLKYNYAIFTNLTQDHLDYHKTMENYALAKQRLFKNLYPNGIAIINADDQYKNYYMLEENNNVTYGLKNGDFKVENYHMNVDGTIFTYKYKDNYYPIKTKLIGEYNIYNILSLVATLSLMGFDFNDISKSILNLDAPVGRMEIIKFKTNNIIIDYAHTPDAIEKIMTSLNPMIKGNIYVIFGCTGDRDRLKRPIMTKYVAHNSKYFIITNDDPHNEDPNQIVEDMIKDLDCNNYEICLDREKAIIKGIKLLDENDALFILGKGHEEKMIVKDKSIPFSDYKVVSKYLDNIDIKETIGS